MCSQVSPMRSSAPGAKFSTSTSQCLTSFSRTSLPFGFFASTVIERLLWLSIVKYRLSTFGMSRSCPRVISPSPARSTLITSAPSHASSCVHVGPDCTCVKSRMRTPSNALPITFPYAISSLPVRRSDAMQSSRLFLRRRIEAGDAAALGAAAFVDDRVDQCRPPRADRFLHRPAELVGRRHVHADAAEGFHQFLVARVLDEDERRRIGPPRRVRFVAAVDAVVVHDHDAHGQVVATD